jgi:hypothetical protein
MCSGVQREGGNMKEAVVRSSTNRKAAAAHVALSGGRSSAEGKLAVKEGVFNILWRTLIFEAP